MGHLYIRFGGEKCFFFLSFILSCLHSSRRVGKSHAFRRAFTVCFFCFTSHFLLKFGFSYCKNFGDTANKKKVIADQNFGLY